MRIDSPSVSNLTFQPGAAVADSNFTGSFSGSFDGDGANLTVGYANITSKPTLISASAEGDAQGQIKFNGVNVNSNALGTDDTPQFASIELGHASDTTLARASSGDVNIEGNVIYRAGGTDVPVADGGTGASTLTDGGVLLGSGTGAITAMAVLTDGQMIVGDGTTDPVAESGATLRTSIGVGTGDSPQLTGIELGHASDTTLTRASSGDVDIEGNIIYRAGGTDVPVTDGGTGVSTLTDGGVLLGSGTGAITAMGVLGDGEMIVGDGTGDPVAESGATLRTSIGVGAGDSPTFTDLTLTGDLTVTGTTTELQVTNLNVEDKNITVASGSADSAAADGAGLTVDGASATFTYTHSGTKWNMNKALDMGANTITTTGAIAGATLNTGQGANELYAMNQDVKTTDDVTFNNVDSDGLVTVTGTGTSQFSSHLQSHCLGIGTAPSTVAGEIRATGDITAYYSSDERLKENFAPLAGALDKVKAIGGYEFDWKDGIEDATSKTGHDIGVKAQEIQAQYPDLVHERDNGYLAVDYIKLSAVLIEAVKELATKVEELSK
jgi:hypothetical protein